MKQHISLKAILPYAVAIAAFVIFSLLYCSPVFEGRALQAGDTDNFVCASHEISTYSASEGRQVWWTDSMFGGMPSYQILASTPSGNLRTALERASHLWIGGDARPVGLILGYLIGFFLMLLCFGVGPWLGIAGAFALTLSSYFLLIIPAGHMTKAIALSCLAPMVGGQYAIFRRRYRLGVPSLLIYGIIGTTLHPQMTYYIAMLMGLLFIAEIAVHAKERRWRDFGVSAGVLVASLLLIFGTKLSWSQMNSDYLAETMRGGHSELSSGAGEERSGKSGLSFEYATAWSYGVDETLTLLIPGFMGGASGYDLGEGSQLEKSLRRMGVPSRQARGFCEYAPTYRGEKPFTSGPVYVGAIICFLFILGLVIVPGPHKWALLAATLFSVALAWGHNFEWLSRLFFDRFPMYDKFRTVESILVVAEFTMPILGFLAVRQLTLPGRDASRDRRSILVAGGITGAVCLVVALFGRGIDVASSYDAQLASQVGDRVYDAILDQRHTMIVSSAWRSLLFVCIGAAILLAYTGLRDRKSSTAALAGALCAAILVDMVPVDRHYFGEDNFVPKRRSRESFAEQPWESRILQDTDPGYRVLNLSANTFNDARTSYRLRSIGGYSAAKLRRYQDLIDAHISKGNPKVLDMLNTRYVVTRDGDVVRNPSALGCAWFVDSLTFVDTPDLESEALRSIDPGREAVSDRKFASVLDLPVSAPDPSASITLDNYVPDRLTYTSVCSIPKVAVFSEIYYPNEWHLYVDDVEVPIGRVDYVLRAAVIPAGRHTLRMEFVPGALRTDRFCTALIILALLLSAALIFVRRTRVS